MDYDYDRYCEILQNLMEDSWRDSDDLEIGRDISNVPEVKIIFDGHGDLDDEDGYVEGGDKNHESYAIFIHKDALTEGFEFPEHDMTPWCLIHRPKEEVCIYAWYNVPNDSWEFLPLEDRLNEGHTMNESDVMKILLGLYDKYYTY